jgi:hypothetical protein
VSQERLTERGCADQPQQCCCNDQSAGRDEVAHRADAIRKPISHEGCEGSAPPHRVRRVTSRARIPLNHSLLTGREQHFISRSLALSVLTGDGPFTAQASALLSRLTGGGKCLLTTSCPHALEMAAVLIDIGPGNEVLMPSFTFASTANVVVVLRGARPVFVDCRPDTFNIDERLLEEAITPRTRAITVVHYAGVACAMDEILDTARRRRFAVVEDNAHGLGGGYHGSRLGSFSSIATQSFHATKNVQCSEGGALVIRGAMQVVPDECVASSPPVRRSHAGAREPAGTTLAPRPRRHPLYIPLRAPRLRALRACTLPHRTAPGGCS